MFINTKGNAILTSGILVILFTLFLLLCNISCQYKEWSYFVFAQRWPPSACLDIKYGTCTIPKNVDGWIIHGLWPTSKKGYPSFCNNSWPFEVEDVKTILPELSSKWPNIMSSSTPTSFWKHEWAKHGTCAVSVSSVDSVLNYFRYTCELHDKFNILEMLRKGMIVPNSSEPYQLKDVENVLETQLNAKVKIFCMQHKNYEYSLLDTIYICLDKNFQQIDCDIPDEPSCSQPSILYITLPQEFENTCYI